MEYKVLIIDDNQMVSESLKRTVPWEQLGLRLAGCTFSAQKGIQMIHELHPDIILTDIHMPDVDGLSMIESIQDELKNVRVIFITAYEKIEYASRAIRLSAFDFILKPIANEELCRSLKRAVDSIQKERDEREEKVRMKSALCQAKFLAALSGGRLEDDRQIFMDFLNQIPDSYFIVSAREEGGISGPSIQRLDYMEIPKELECVTAVADGDIVLFCGMNGGQESWERTARKVADAIVKDLLNVIVAVSGLHSSPSEIQTAHEEVKQTLLQNKVYGHQAQIEFFDQKSNGSADQTRLVDIERFCDEMAKKVDFIDEEQMWLRVLEKSGGKFRVIRIILMYFCTKVTQEMMNHSRWGDTGDLMVYDISRLNSVEEAKKWLDRFLEVVKRPDMPINSKLICGVLEYIKTHAAEGLTLETVADTFCVSPGHLSMLIKKETGVTYRDHVIKAKIAVAKNMLDDTRMRVEDIAYAIGYENYISFYHVFKKVENLSPSEYRFRKGRK